jgi:NAD(P)H dehydrogenase (quinone)
MTIVVIGATGNTGRAVVKELKALGQDPIAVVRNPDKARDVLGAGTKTAVADLADKAALEKALKGADAVFLTTNVNPQLAEQNTNAIDAALAAGVKVLVRLSAGRAVVGPDSLAPSGRTHYAIDQRLRGLNIGWVILRPGLFMQNYLGQAAGIKNDGKLVNTASADLGIAYVDVRDTGAIAARILIDPKPHLGKEYEFTGKSVTLPQFADAFSQVLGKKVSYVPVTLEQNEQAVRARGLPDWLTTHLLAIAKITATGGFSTEDTKAIKDIVKRDPITVKQFVTDFKGAFS